MPARKPEYGLADAADEDLLAIARYTIETWGIEQARRYDGLLEDHFRAIGRKQVQSRHFLKSRPGLMFSRCEHHYVFHLVGKNRCPIIIAGFHENMDLMTEVKKRLRK